MGILYGWCNEPGGIDGCKGEGDFVSGKSIGIVLRLQDMTHRTQRPLCSSERENPVRVFLNSLSLLENGHNVASDR
jgi:hypothetical protein